MTAIGNLNKATQEWVSSTLLAQKNIFRGEGIPRLASGAWTSPTFLQDRVVLLCVLLSLSSQEYTVQPQVLPTHLRKCRQSRNLSDPEYHEWQKGGSLLAGQRGRGSLLPRSSVALPLLLWSALPEPPPLRPSLILEPTVYSWLNLSAAGQPRENSTHTGRQAGTHSGLAAYREGCQLLREIKSDLLLALSPGGWHVVISRWNFPWQIDNFGISTHWIRPRLSKLVVNSDLSNMIHSSCRPSGRCRDSSKADNRTHRRLNTGQCHPIFPSMFNLNSLRKSLWWLFHPLEQGRPICGLQATCNSLTYNMQLSKKWSDELLLHHN